MAGPAKRAWEEKELVIASVSNNQPMHTRVSNTLASRSIRGSTISFLFFVHTFLTSTYHGRRDVGFEPGSVGSNVRRVRAFFEGLHALFVVNVRVEGGVQPNVKRHSREDEQECVGHKGGGRLGETERATEHLACYYVSHKIESVRKL